MTSNCLLILFIQILRSVFNFLLFGNMVCLKLYLGWISLLPANFLKVLCLCLMNNYALFLRTVVLICNWIDSLCTVPVLWNRNGLLRFQFRLWKIFSSDSGFCSGSQTIFDNIFQKWKIAQNLAFSMPEAASFPESWSFAFDFLTFYHLNVGSGSKSGFGTGSGV